MPLRYLTALPVYNEAQHVSGVLDEVRRHSDEILVVDDGSDDGTSDILAGRPDILRVTHPRNLGYGAALISAFNYAIENDYDVVTTIDCDGQHEPQRIPRFQAACDRVDIVSGSRYLKQYPGDSTPPSQRRWINQLVSSELEQSLGLKVTDAFCGFKAYRVKALAALHLTEPGYAMPLELWVQAAYCGLSMIELPVPLIYLDEERSFGGALDDGNTRLEYYRSILGRSIEQAEAMGLKRTDSPHDAERESC